MRKHRSNGVWLVQKGKRPYRARRVADITFPILWDHIVAFVLRRKMEISFVATVPEDAEIKAESMMVRVLPHISGDKLVTKDEREGWEKVR